LEIPASLIAATRPFAHVLQVSLDRPAQRNALSNALLQQLADVLTAASLDDEIRCVVLCGGPALFSAGADIKEMQRDGFAAIDNPARVAAWRVVEGFRKPIVVAIEGIAYGGGHELAMLGDIAIAGASARFAQPEINIGILPGDGATQRLARTIGKSLTMLMVLTGQPISAQAALQAGLIAEICPDGEANARALAVAAMIASKAPTAARLAKEAVLAAYETPLAMGLAVERSAIRHAFTTEDQSEGMRAFVEKRPARFTGR
jgi:enoyl-CoA hydratase